MDALQDIIERAKKLSPAELRKLADVIEERIPDDLEEVETPEEEERRLASFDRLLALMGTGQSDFTDVARNKHKHLAEIYADKHLPEAKK